MRERVDDDARASALARWRELRASFDAALRACVEPPTAQVRDGCGFEIRPRSATVFGSPACAWTRDDATRDARGRD